VPGNHGLAPDIDDPTDAGFETVPTGKHGRNGRVDFGVKRRSDVLS
jgi:hypothetical protein